MSKSEITKIRNVGIVSHGGGGATSLVECLLFNAKAIKEMGGQYILPFCFKNSHGNRTSHHLVFVSKDVKESDLKVGMAVKVVPLKLPDDKLAYQFVKA